MPSAKPKAARPSATSAGKLASTSKPSMPGRRNHSVEAVGRRSLAQQAHAVGAPLAKWEKRLPKVVTSLREAGDELLAFYRLPQSQWKCARATNTIERLNKEFRRRVKPQGALPTVQTAEILLYGLWLTGEIKMRRIDRWQQISAIPAALATTEAR